MISSTIAGCSTLSHTFPSSVHRARVSYIPSSAVCTTTSHLPAGVGLSNRSNNRSIVNKCNHHLSPSLNLPSFRLPYCNTSTFISDAVHHLSPHHSHSADTPQHTMLDVTATHNGGNAICQLSSTNIGDNSIHNIPSTIDHTCQHQALSTRLHPWQVQEHTVQRTVTSHPPLSCGRTQVHTHPVGTTAVWQLATIKCMVQANFPLRRRWCCKSSATQIGMLNTHSWHNSWPSLG